MSPIFWIPIASGFDLTGLVWAEEDLPVVIEWSGLPDGLDHDEVVQALDAARSAWVDGSCTSFDVAFVEVEGPLHPDRDGVPMLAFGDPEDQLSTDIQAATFSYRGDETVDIHGREYDTFADADTVFNDDVDFGTDADAAAEDCEDLVSFQAVLTHELGHLAGIGHGCESGEACDRWEREATMYGELEPCDDSASTVEADDRLALLWLYGPGAAASASPDPVDPMMAHFRVDHPEGAVATWDFGDGAGGEGTELDHTYASPGEYAASACFEVEGCDVPACVWLTVWAVGPGTVTGDTGEPDERDGARPEAEAGCGCATPGVPSPAWLFVLLALRRRR